MAYSHQGIIQGQMSCSNILQATRHDTITDSYHFMAGAVPIEQEF